MSDFTLKHKIVIKLLMLQATVKKKVYTFVLVTLLIYQLNTIFFEMLSMSVYNIGFE